MSIISTGIKKKATNYPVVVRESAPMTTPPLNSTAIIVVYNKRCKRLNSRICDITSYIVS